MDKAIGVLDPAATLPKGYATHTHEDVLHTHVHQHITHHVRGAQFTRVDHLVSAHEHQHNHAQVQHAHQPHEDPEREHLHEAHIHDHDHPWSP